MNALTTEQVAKRLGITPTRVRVLIRDGRLPAQRFGRAHLIDEANLQLLTNRKPGRPRHKQIEDVISTPEMTAEESSEESSE